MLKVNKSTSTLATGFMIYLISYSCVHLLSVYLVGTN